jgi:tetratricopeptide (TPR) repeat protein
MVHLYFDWDWEAAGRELDLALALNPSLATAHVRKATLLTSQGRFEEALREAEMASGLDPFAVGVNLDVGLVYWAMGEYERALRLGRLLQQTHPEASAGYQLEGLAREQIGPYEDAVAALRRARELDDGPVILAFYVSAQAVAGQREGAKAAYRELGAIPYARYVCPYELATAALSLGRTDEALDWFEAAVEARADCWVWASVDPRLEPIRDHPRFQELARRVGVPAVSPRRVAVAARPGRRQR